MKSGLLMQIHKLLLITEAS